MATKDFRASQLETSKIIGSGSISGTTVGIAIYSGSIASDRSGGTSDSAMFNNVGSDVFLFVSGTTSNSDNTRINATLFGGDVVISGTLYAERQVIEVDSVADGDFFVTGNFYQEPDSNSTKSAAFRNAAGNDILIVDSTNQRVGIGVSDPDSTLEVFSTSTQLKLSNNTDDFATFAVGTNGDLAITTVDTAGGNANFEVNADGAVDIDANAGSLSLDGSTGINIGTATDVAIDIDSATLDIDASGAISIDGTSAIGITSTSSDTTVKSTGARVVLSGSSGSDSVLVQSDMEIVGSLHGASPLKINDDIALTGSARFKEQLAPTAGANEAVLYAKDDSGVTKLFTKQSDGTEVGPLGSGGSLNDSYDTPDGGGTKSAGAGAVITVDGQPVQIVRNTPGDVVLSVTGSAIFGETSSEFGNHLPPLPGDDTMFFFSGSIDSIGLDTGGVTTFGGDVFISGALGVNTVRVTSDGKVGIGTDNPSYKLEVGGNAAFGEYLYHRGDADTSIRFEDDKITLQAGSAPLLTLTEDAQDIVIVGDTARDIDFQVKTSGDTHTLFVQGSSDRVGMGTNSPASILHIKESSPTVTIQRESNANNSTLQFMGQAGAIANMVHMATTNDLVFSTHDGVDQEEILRLGSHYDTDVRQVILLSGSQMAASAMQPKEASDINFFVSGAIGSKGTSTRGTAVFGGDVAISGSLYKSVTTYAFYQNGTPTGDPTNEFHFEWATGTVNDADPEASTQNDFWMFFPKGGRILDVTARGGGTDNFSSENPFSQRLVVAMYLWGDDWINSSNNVTHAGYTPIGHVTSSIPSDDVANESGTYSHKAVWNMDYEYFRNNATGSLEIPSGNSISLTFKGIDTSGALSNTNFFVTVERDL